MKVSSVPAALTCGDFVTIKSNNTDVFFCVILVQFRIFRVNDNYLKLANICFCS